MTRVHSESASSSSILVNNNNNTNAAAKNPYANHGSAVRVNDCHTDAGRSILRSRNTPADYCTHGAQATDTGADTRTVPNLAPAPALAPVPAPAPVTVDLRVGVSWRALSRADVAVAADDAHVKAHAAAAAAQAAAQAAAAAAAKTGRKTAPRGTQTGKAAAGKAAAGKQARAPRAARTADPWVCGVASLAPAEDDAPPEERFARRFPSFPRVRAWRALQLAQELQELEAQDREQEWGTAQRKSKINIRAMTDHDDDDDGDEAKAVRAINDI